MKVDVLYLCHGRKRFTAETLPILLQNTNWSRVNEFIVYNDATPDHHETSELLQRILPDGVTVRQTNLASPVGVMNHFLWRSDCDAFAKIDNDIIVPSGWLDSMIDVLDHDQSLQLLGMEPGMSAQKAPELTPECYTWTPASHIGGVGLMRTSAFDRPWPRPNGRFGFTEWQHHYVPERGWIEPDLRMFALDQLPFEPWIETTQRYVDQDLNRAWPKYPRDMDFYWSWWL